MYRSPKFESRSNSRRADCAGAKQDHIGSSPNHLRLLLCWLGLEPANRVRMTFAGSPFTKCRAFVVTFPIVTIGGVEFHWACARLNNSVIRGTNTVSGKFKRNDVMEALMRTYIVAIAAAALFAIPTAAFSESGHHRYYNRYEGLLRSLRKRTVQRIASSLQHKEE